MTTAPLLPALTARVRAQAHARTPACPCGAATLADRPDGTVVRHGDVVAKAHAPDTDADALAHRLSFAARHPGILLPPLAPAPAGLHGRPVTWWPYGTPVDPDAPDAAPWEAAGALLARLHRTSPPPTPTTPPPLRAPVTASTPTAPPSPRAPLQAPAPTALPPMRGPVKAAAALARLRRSAPGHPDAAPVLRAWAALPGWARAEDAMPGPTTPCHGDFHLGQLVRHPAPDGPWLLIDVDDLGRGVPAWDLARPAAWYACGLLSSDEWTRFLAAYRSAGGPAVPPDGDPWPALDVPARALTAQTAARALVKAVAADRPLDEVERSLVEACARMASVPAQIPGS